MPYLNSNIPSEIFHTSIGSEIIRITKRTTCLLDMVTRVNLVDTDEKVR